MPTTPRTRPARTPASASHRLTVAGVDTHFYDAGRGDVPVLCVHGNPDSADQWLPLLEANDRLGRVIAPDLPGWGRSEIRDRDAFDGSLDAHARWFEAFLDAQGIDRFRLVVHDWGSVALAAACRRPDRVERLVVIDIVPLSDRYKWHWISRYLWRPPVVGEVTMTLFNRTTVKLLTRLQRPRLRPLPDAWLDNVGRDLDRQMKAGILKLYRSADPDVLAHHGARLGEVTCPALLIWGEKDPYVGTEHVETVAAQLGSDPERWIVPGAGHWCMLDSPEVLARTADFLAAAG